MIVYKENLKLKNEIAKLQKEIYLKKTAKYFAIRDRIIIYECIRKYTTEYGHNWLLHKFNNM